MNLKTFSAIIFTVLVNISVFSQKQPDNPNTQNNNSNQKTNSGFFNDDPDFMINFLGQVPTKNESEVDTEVGKVLMITYMLEEGSSVAYMIAKARYPAEKIRNSNPDDMLNASVNGFIGNLKLIISEKRDISLGIYPGKFFKSKSSIYYNATADYLVKNTLYQIAILRADRAPTEKEIQDFIFTFALK
jgi:hypothetical protein